MVEKGGNKMRRDRGRNGKVVGVIRFSDRVKVMGRGNEKWKEKTTLRTVGRSG